MPECVFQCRHPVWNSRGNCSANVCSCGPGFVSNDSLGNPSCVPETALVGIFASVGTLAGLALVICSLEGLESQGGSSSAWGVAQGQQKDTATSAADGDYEV